MGEPLLAPTGRVGSGGSRCTRRRSGRGPSRGRPGQPHVGPQRRAVAGRDVAEPGVRTAAIAVPAWGERLAGVEGVGGRRGRRRRVTCAGSDSYAGLAEKAHRVGPGGELAPDQAALEESTVPSATWVPSRSRVSWLPSIEVASSTSSWVVPGRTSNSGGTAVALWTIVWVPRARATTADDGEEGADQRRTTRHGTDRATRLPAGRRVADTSRSIRSPTTRPGRLTAVRARARVAVSVLPVPSPADVKRFVA